MLVGDTWTLLSDNKIYKYEIVQIYENTIRVKVTSPIGVSQCVQHNIRDLKYIGYPFDKMAK